MGAACAKGSGEGNEAVMSTRVEGITGGGGGGKKALPKLPPNATRSHPEDHAFIEESLARILLFSKLDPGLQRKIVAEMFEREVQAGEILINEGDTGLAATELYVVKSGKFEVLQRRQGQNIRVNMKERSDCFGEISLMYDTSRNATVAATVDSVVWVMNRDVFR
jgi:signal-transduction protein with cAMP-binding, CBS, and nucleotidyltransferase domain